MVTPESKKLWAVELLCKKEEELGRLPKKEDFDEITRSRIKAFLGPWPRALEAAGLKEAKPAQKKSKKRRKTDTRKKSVSEVKESGTINQNKEKLIKDGVDLGEGAGS